MNHVYYTLLGVLAFAGIGLMAVAIFKLVIFMGDKIEEWIEQRRRKSAPTSHGILSPNEARELQGLEIYPLPFCHIRDEKHSYKIDTPWLTFYHFKCAKCNYSSYQDREEFWGRNEVRT